jgi:hypothetical protein
VTIESSLEAAPNPGEYLKRGIEDLGKAGIAQDLNLRIGELEKIYSYRKASIGLTLEARRAGK